MKQNAKKASEAVIQIRRLLGEWLRTSSESRESVADILSLLETVDEYVRFGGDGKPGIKTISAARSSAATYTIDKQVNGQEVLSEHRGNDTSQPFRVSKDLYTAVAKVLASAEEPLEFADLTAAVKEAYADPAEFHLRTVIRFWMSMSPPLVSRERKRHRAVEKGRFEKAADAAWTKLAKQSVKG